MVSIKDSGLMAQASGFRIYVLLSAVVQGASHLGVEHGLERGGLWGGAKWRGHELGLHVKFMAWGLGFGVKGSGFRI
jgi:hypothetical protein